MTYVLFASNDLYSWKLQNSPFLERPSALTALPDSNMLTHQHTWDACQQLLQVIFTTERIVGAAWKLVQGTNGLPTQVQADIDAAFPLIQPDWDFNTAEGKGEARSKSTARF